MLFTISVLFGLLVGAGLLVGVGRAERSDAGSVSRRAWTAWLVLAIGVAGAAGLGFAVLGGVDSTYLVVVSISLPVAGVVLTTGRLLAGDRRWQVWAGAVFAFVPALFWLVFVVAELFGPPH